MLDFGYPPAVHPGTINPTPGQLPPYPGTSTVREFYETGGNAYLFPTWSRRCGGRLRLGTFSVSPFISIVTLGRQEYLQSCHWLMIRAENYLLDHGPYPGPEPEFIPLPNDAIADWVHDGGTLILSPATVFPSSSIQNFEWLLGAYTDSINELVGETFQIWEEDPFPLPNQGLNQYESSIIPHHMLTLGSIDSVRRDLKRPEFSPILTRSEVAGNQAVDVIGERKIGKGKLIISEVNELISNAAWSVIIDYHDTNLDPPALDDQEGWEYLLID